MQPRFTFEPTTHGQGGFAKVNKGRDNILERDIAVKVLNPLVKHFPEADQERFRREARILAKLIHPNIPAIYDVDFSDGNFLIIFQFIEGKTLQKLIDEEGACTISEAKQWFYQIASALDHAHGLGVIHRDIKPENIIITPNRESAYLVDFGIALTHEDSKKLTQSGFVIGTPGYMSPEQQMGEELDQRTDIYSLGITFYETLAGKRFPGGAYEELSQVNEAISPQIDELIRESLLPREKRLPTAKAFSQRLSTALASSKPLSEILAHGRIHELAAAIEDLNASEFVQLPEGQKALILAKLADITSSGDDRLGFASEELLELLLSRGMLLPADDYREIVSAAVKWGFETNDNGHYLGGDRIRRAIEQAAYVARGDAHSVIADEFCKTIVHCDFESKENWFLHLVRAVVQTLLANPSCEEHSSELVRILKTVNRTQRERR